MTRRLPNSVETLSGTPSHARREIAHQPTSATSDIVYASKNPRSSLKILRARREDIPEMVDVSIESFRDDLSQRLAFPDFDEAKKKMRKRFEDVFDQPRLWIWKAVEVSSGDQDQCSLPRGANNRSWRIQGGGEADKIVGVAIWVTSYAGEGFSFSSTSDMDEGMIPMVSFMGAGLLMSTSPSSKSSRTDSTGTPKFIDAVHEYISSIQDLWIKDKDVLYLAALGVLPNHQGQGIGSALLKVGMDRADKEGICSWLEASPAGYPVYLHRGWRIVDIKEFDLSRWAGEDRGYGVFRFRAMLRLPVPKK